MFPSNYNRSHSRMASHSLTSKILTLDSTQLFLSTQSSTPSNSLHFPPIPPTFPPFKLIPKTRLSITLVRYQLPVVVIVFNNGGVYGGDPRNPEEIAGPCKDDPAPTSFVPGAAYHTLIEAFGGKGYLVGTPAELKFALAESFATRKPTVINVIIDPYAGAESGRMQHKN